jgi:autotransporter passenger strand-loop-strand repeat protein
VLVRDGVTTALGTFSGLGVGLTHALGTIALTPSSIGTVNETIILDPTDSGLGALPARTLTVEATVVGTPVITAPKNATVTSGHSVAIGGVSLAEIGNFAGETFTAQLMASTGTLFAAGTAVTGSGTRNLSIEGSLAQINAALATLRDAENITGTDTISLAAIDSLGEFGGFSHIAVTVNPVPALVPTLTVPGSLTLNVGQTAAIAGISVAEAGGTPGETFTVKLTDSFGLLSAAGEGVTGAGSKALTISGTLAQVNAALATLKDVDATAGADKLNLAVTDSLGNSASAALGITANTQLLIEAPSTAAVTAGVTAAIGSPISISESGSTMGEIFTVKLTDSFGLLFATGTGITGSGSKALTVSGSLAQVNADLATLKLVEKSAGGDTITLTATDSIGTSPPTETIAVTTTATMANGVPVLTAPAAVALSTTLAGAISGISVSESGNTAGETFTVKLTDSHGLLSATGTGITGSGSKALTLSGSLAQVNAGLATLTDLDATAGADVVTLTASDSLGHVATAKTISVTATGSVTSGVPVLTAPATKSLTAGVAAIISGISLSESPVLSSEVFTVQLSDSHGLLSATGTGVTGSGSKALTLSGSLAQVNAELKTLTDTDLTAGADKIVLTASDSLGGKASPVAIAVSNAGTVSGGITISSGQPANNLTVSSGGSALLNPGGTANNTTIGANGAAGALPGSSMTNTTIGSGGLQAVAGAAINTKVGAGGEQIIGIGGFSNYTTIGSGGTEYVELGATAFNSTIEGGGTLVVGATGKLGGGLNFAGSHAVLSLAGTVMPDVIISGFDLNGASGDEIVLTGFTYAAGHDTATLGAGNTLTLDLNGKLEKLKLNSGENYLGHGFSITTNGLDQVVVIDPVTGSEAQQMAFLAPPTEAKIGSSFGQILAHAASAPPEIRGIGSFATGFSAVDTKLPVDPQKPPVAGLAAGLLMQDQSAGMVSVAAKLVSHAG